MRSGLVLRMFSAAFWTRGMTVYLLRLPPTFDLCQSSRPLLKPALREEKKVRSRAWVRWVVLGRRRSGWMPSSVQALAMARLVWQLAPLMKNRTGVGMPCFLM